MFLALDLPTWHAAQPEKKNTIQISRWFFVKISTSSAWFSALILTLMLYRMPQIREIYRIESSQISSSLYLYLYIDYLNYLVYYWKVIQILKFEIQVFQDAYNYTHWFFGFPRHIIGSILAPDFLQKWWKNAPFLNLNLAFEASSSLPAQLLSYHGFNVPENSHLFILLMFQDSSVWSFHSCVTKKNSWFRSCLRKHHSNMTWNEPPSLKPAAAPHLGQFKLSKWIRKKSWNYIAACPRKEVLPK